MEELIKRAIQNKQLLSFTYEDCNRVVEPYTYGLTRNGKEALRAYQTEGESRSNDSLGWRLFLLSEIENMTLLNNKYSSFRQGYNPNDRGMSKIYITA